ncbi:MAG: NAD(P)H-dependent oxidoreductase [Bdellovibrionales bacterium]|jgi:nitroreductase|nr:NAD(P)H-dependent oxidoreductase [Bdellovibrionales bacterium]
MEQKLTLIQNALNWRYATKKYDPTKTLSKEEWSAIETALLQAPSSYGLQPWKALLIESKDLRAQLREISWNQPQVTDASHYVVLLARDAVSETDIDTYMQRIAEVRGVDLDSLQGFKDMLVKNVVQGLEPNARHTWAQRQAYIGMGFALETAALVGVDATPMEGLDARAYDKLLKLENTGWKTVAAIAFGHRHAEDAYQTLKKVRKEASSLIERR